MYTVQQLAPSELAQFSRLAFPQHRPMLLSGDVEPGFVAIGAKLFGQPVGLAFAGSKDSPGVARLEFCMVDPRQRRAGVGQPVLMPRWPTLALWLRPTRLQVSLVA